MLSIEEICKKAIPLSDCPVKKQNEIARRIWLAKQIQLLLTGTTVGPSEFKNG
jgi:hypothetical protein